MAAGNCPGRLGPKHLGLVGARGGGDWTRREGRASAGLGPVTRIVRCAGPVRVRREREPDMNYQYILKETQIKKHKKMKIMMIIFVSGDFYNFIKKKPEDTRNINKKNKQLFNDYYKKEKDIKIKSVLSM